MLTIVKPVYYCEHCKRHRMTAASILKHEPRCIYNPLRSVCGWHHGTKPLAPADLVAVFQDDLDLDHLRRNVADCPACMLAVVVQACRAGVDREDLDFDYQTEVERFRESERYVDVW